MKIQRNFRSGWPVEALIDFVETHPLCPAPSYELCSNFPKILLERSRNGRTPIGSLLGDTNVLLWVLQK